MKAQSPSPQQATTQSAATSAIAITVQGEDHLPIPGAAVVGTQKGAEVCRGITDAAGHASLICPVVHDLQLQVSLDGYVPATAAVTQEEAASHAEIEMTLLRSQTVQQNVTVQADSESPLTETTSSAGQLPVEQAKVSPLRPATLVDALPLVPGVIRTPDGRTQINGVDESHSALLINSVNVNDPATGDFGLSVPVDSVETLKVLQSPYLAQYGSFLTGVVNADTKRGGDKWDYGLNDPLPDFRIRSGHLVGVRDASPRLNFGGPLVKNHLYVAEGSEYLVDKSEVRTLPFPDDETRFNAFNSFTQVDALIGSRNTLTGTLHFAPHSLRYANLNYFDPQPVTPNGDYQEDSGALTHRLGLGGGELVSTVAGIRDASNIDGQGTATMLLSPTGNSGSYFNQQTREATRYQWLETWSPAPIELHGQHMLQFGTVMGHAEDDGQVTSRDVEIHNTSGQLLRTISWQGNGLYSLKDFEGAVYGQDHWILNSRLAIDAGLRAETQSLTYTNRIAPRTGFTLTPWENNRTVIRGGIGVFYDTVPLDTYAFESYPEQVVTTYDGNGKITDGPRTYLNLTSTDAQSKFPFLDQDPHAGNFAPYSIAWNLEAEHTIVPAFALRVRYVNSAARNQLTLTPEITSTQSALVLNGSGELNTHQTEFTARVGAEKERQFFFSYVRQFARGDISNASSYLGDFPSPVVQQEIEASTPGEVPNRFLFWGMSKLPWRMRISPHLEYRNGFTWQPVDVMQNYIPLESAPQPRYPRYFSANARLAKDFDVGSHHAIRLSVTGINLTNHNNWLQVHNNIADPEYGTFFGNYGRHLLLDFDFLH
ncbi:TonB-dependent receptor plug domain-containing protein [Silvibacterium dinghuense]|nr:TonB-dependent receptor plug domain-containing protein [Silvibacterium dinghuense]